MKCPACAKEILGDSKFCPFCGAVITPPSVQEMPATVEITRDVKKTKSSKKVITIVLAVATVLSLALTGFLAYTNSICREEIASQKSVIDSQSSEIKKLKSQADRDANTIAAQKIKVATLDSIIRAVRNSKLSSTSSHFNVDRYIICMRKNSTASLKLTANWSHGGTVSTSSSNTSVARALFAEDNWYTSTTLTIQSGFIEGVSIITFSNNVDNITFDVLVIVTD